MHAPVGEPGEPGGPLVERADAAEIPELGEAHEEPVVAVDQGDVGAVAEPGAQRVHCGQTTETSAEDDDVGHRRNLPRATYASTTSMRMRLLPLPFDSVLTTRIRPTWSVLAT